MSTESAQKVAINHLVDCQRLANPCGSGAKLRHAKKNGELHMS